MVNKIIVTKGQRFNYLRVIKEIPNVGKGRIALFKCDCGTTKIIRLGLVVRGTTKSCGCYRKSYMADKQYKHGLCGDYTATEDNKLYKVWKDMHSRCYDKNNKSYYTYGKRSIKVNKIWHTQTGLIVFVAWAKENGFKPGLQLDRKNNDKEYSPSNCRFVTQKRNARNTSKTIMIVHPKTDKAIALIDYYEEKSRKINFDRFRAKYHAGKYPHLQAA